jgi:hypothetical protein
MRTARAASPEIDVDALTWPPEEFHVPTAECRACGGIALQRSDGSFACLKCGHEFRPKPAPGKNPAAKLGVS